MNGWVSTHACKVKQHYLPQCDRAELNVRQTERELSDRSVPSPSPSRMLGLRKSVQAGGGPRRQQGPQRHGGPQQHDGPQQQQHDEPQRHDGPQQHTGPQGHRDGPQCGGPQGQCDGVVGQQQHDGLQQQNGPQVVGHEGPSEGQRRHDVGQEGPQGLHDEGPRQADGVVGQEGPQGPPAAMVPGGVSTSSGGLPGSARQPFRHGCA